MKKFISRLLICTALTGCLASCNNFFDTEYNEGIDVDNGLTSVDNIKYALNGTYYQLFRFYFAGNYSLTIGDMAGDMAYLNGSANHWTTINHYSVTADDSYLSSIWEYGYKVVDNSARIIKAGIRAEAIHGNKSQNARQRALTGFKNHELRVLIATDIAARGIDVDQLSHVINYELPNIPETYVHRIGRTGRAGHDGIALSFCESEELPYLKDIQKLIGKSIPVIKEHPFVTADGLKAQKIKTEEIKAKTKENKIYRGSRTNGDFWRRKKQTSQNNTPKGVGR